MKLQSLSVVLLLLTATLVHAQSTSEQVEPILGKQLQSPEMVTFQLRQYLMTKRPATLPTPKSAQEWTAEAKRIKKRLLDEVVFHGWPKEWVNSAPKFEDLGMIPSGKGYRMRKLRYEIVPGFYSTAILYEPENLRGKVPAILNVNGHWLPQGKSLDFKQKRCINHALQGMLALNIEWLGMGELFHPENDHLKLFGVHLDLVGANAVGLFHLAMRRGLDYLERHPNADPSRLGVTGLSGGGWQTIFLSSLDERVAVSIPVAGFSTMASQAERESDMGDIEQNPTDFRREIDFSTLTALRAPSPTLLLYNAEDECCFRGPLVKPHIFDPVKPFFRLYGKEAAFQWYENTDPSTHNYEVDNRQQSYRFFSKHFNLPIVEREIPVDSEVKSYDELVVGLPKDSLTILGLAKKLASEIKRLPVPTEATAKAAWITSERAKLKSLVRYTPVALQHPWALDNTKNKGVESLSYRFEFGNGLSATGVWFKGIATSEQATLTIVLNDKGKKASAVEVSERINRGEQVLAVDLLFTGDAAPEKPTPGRFMPLLSTLGDRPIGMEAAQLITLANWLQGLSKSPKIRLQATGIRSQMAVLIASALEPKLFSTVVVHEGMQSLSYLLDAPITDQGADLFCLDLYKEFDIDRLAVLAEPAVVIHQRYLSAAKSNGQ